MAHQHDHEKLIDIALDLCMRQRYCATTLDQICAAASLVPADFACCFATKDAIIMSLAEDIAHAGVAALARIAPNTDPLEALLIAYTETLAAIANGVGVMPRERLLALAHILTTQLHLRQQVTAISKRVHPVPLAVHMGVAPDDRRVRHAITPWAAIVTGSYNYTANVDPHVDGRVPELMAQRLNETFAHVIGQEPPRQAAKN